MPCPRNYFNTDPPRACASFCPIARGQIPKDAPERWHSVMSASDLAGRGITPHMLSNAAMRGILYRDPMRREGNGYHKAHRRGIPECALLAYLAERGTGRGRGGVNFDAMTPEQKRERNGRARLIREMLTGLAPGRGVTKRSLILDALGERARRLGLGLSVPSLTLIGAMCGATRQYVSAIKKEMEAGK